jgi:hypothetical protein
MKYYISKRAITPSNIIPSNCCKKGGGYGV